MYHAETCMESPKEAFGETILANPDFQADGIHALLPREKMVEGARKMRDAYARVPGAPLYRQEFGYMEGVKQRWISEGLANDADWSEEFFYDPWGKYTFNVLGWCEASFCPVFEDKVVEDRGEHEVYQDFAGRHVLVFKGRRQGFMPEYIDHPVKDMKSWVEKCKWRMDPQTPGRWTDFEQRAATAKAKAGQGMILSEKVIGGYMYLRSLVGPTELMYAVYDMPEVLHDCMQTWLNLADKVIARHQQHVTLDELFLAEDICYNHGLLVSPGVMKEFLFPYYQQLLANIRSRQIDRNRHLHVHVDTDGLVTEAIAQYRQAIGVDVMSPFEVASGCDVTEIGRRWPELAIFGGIDKRVLAQGPKAIDEHLERILPALRARGGYIPTCDHAVPLEVSLANYRHYRKRCVELGG